jgi:hypothetical protein
MIPNLTFDLIARDLTGRAFSSLSEKVNGIQNRFKALGTSLGGIGQKMTRLGTGLSLGVTAPLAAIGKGMIDAASDAQEAASAFDVLFGAQAASTRAWADSTAKAMGRSTYELQKQAASFQQLFSKAAPTGEAAADLSTKFAALAQDLASFYNVTEQDALEKLRSGLAGQSEPMRAFGVFLTEGAVKAKALQMGLGGTNGVLSEQEKILARAQLIWESTNQAQGDAERTSGSYANQVRALGAAWNDLSVKLGTALLPMATKAVTVLTSLANAFLTLSPATQEWIMIGAGAAATFGPVLMVLGSMASGVAALLPMLPILGAAFTALISPIGLVVAAFASIAAVWVYWDELKAAFPRVTAVINEALASMQAAFDATVEKVKAIGTAMVAMKDAAIAAVTELVNGVTEWITNKLNAVWDAAASKIQWVSDKFNGLYEAVVGHSFIPDMVKGIGAWMGKLSSLMVAPAADAAARTGEAFKSAGDDMSSMFEGFGSSIAEAIKGTKSWTDVLADALGMLGKMALQSMNFGGGMGGLFKGLLGGLFGFATGGSFQVGGSGGIDSQLVAFKASPNETVSVNRPGQTNGGAPQAVNINVSINGATGNQEIVRLVQQGIAQAVPGIVGASVESVSKRNALSPGYLRGAA